MLGKHYISLKILRQSTLAQLSNCFLPLLFFSPFLLFAQPNVQPASIGIQSPESLVRDIFKGNGVEILSVVYQGNPSAVGAYNNLEEYIPIDKGVILTTGSAELAQNANLSQNAGTLWNDQTQDPNLAFIASDPIEDVAVFEITFIPTFDKIAFKYAFASEEYPEYACTDFNDVFGFFLFGPNPAGGLYDATNIARVPDPTDPTGLTLTNIPVSINSINSNGINPGMGCDYDFSQYHNVISNGDFPTYDGFIDPFWAIADVVPCESYSIKIGIADVSDDELDSAIFLEGKSFSGIGPAFILPEDLSATYLVEGCDNLSLGIGLPFPIDDNYTFNINLIGDAANGEDFLNIPIAATIPAGASSISINIEPFDDGIVEGIETMGIIIDICDPDTFWINISDQPEFDPGFPDTISQCTGPIQIEGNSNNNSNQSFSNFSSQAIPEIIDGSTNNPPILMSEIEVTGLPYFNLTASNIHSVCIEIDHEASWHLDLYLKTPYGKTIELSSKNGNTGNDYLETCFSPTATENISAATSPFDGEYLPEESFNELNEFSKSVDGTWALFLKDNSPGTVGSLIRWEITFNTGFTPVYVWSPSTGLSCSTCPDPIADPLNSTNYTVTFNDSNGCKTTDEVRIEREFPTVQGISTPIDCPGNNSGYITAEILSDGVAPYNFDWGTLGSDSIIGPLGAGEYTVTISDSNGCTGEQIVFLNDPDSIKIEFESIPPCSEVDNNGMLTAIPSGGMSAYEFQWSINAQGATTAMIDGLSVGDYFVTVIDDLGCSVEEKFSLSSGDFEIDLAIVDVLCFGEQNGSILAQPLGGTPPFEYILNGISQGSNNQFISLLVGDYDLEVFDSNGCSLQIPNININGPDAFTIDLGPDLTIYLGEKPTLDIDIFNAQGNLSDMLWNWNENDLPFLSCTACTTPRLVDIEFPRTFELTLVDTSGCRATDQLTIAVNKPRRFFVPTGFTPNSDQLNELLLTHGDERAVVELFQLYDRWGALVFEATDFKVGAEDIGWDGSMRGSHAEPGVYVWVAKVRFSDDAVIQFNGESTLIR